MLLTISLLGEHTEDLGYLLHKNPYRAQWFELNFGKAYVFYPEAGEHKTTAALLLDINPIDLARGKLGSKDGGLFDYVNDRPYAVSSFMSTAIARIFGTAMSGKCSKKQALADSPLELEANITMLPCQGNDEFVREIFEPLGYAVTVKKSMLDEQFEEWGESPYVDLTIKGKIRLAELLNHLYVLIPVFDRKKHYYVAADEVEKLLKHGEGWLKNHPHRNKIISRYFPMCKSYANETIRRISEDDIFEEAEENENTSVVEQAERAENAAASEQKEKKKPLNQQRLEAVIQEVIASGAGTVIDMGCGDGKLTELLLKQKQLDKIAAADVSVQSLERAAERLKIDRMSEYKRKRLDLFQASLTYRDERFSGYDTACIIEVIEHLDVQRIEAFERVVFEFAAPNTVILTTPNVEYNSHYGIENGTLRHDDHRFEWTREQFKNWCENVSKQFNYTVVIKEIGEPDENLGSPTQMGVFRKCV